MIVFCARCGLGYLLLPTEERAERVTWCCANSTLRPTAWRCNTVNTAIFVNGEWLTARVTDHK